MPPVSGAQPRVHNIGTSTGWRTRGGSRCSTGGLADAGPFLALTRDIGVTQRPLADAITSVMRATANDGLLR
jgi:hypothetical protein